MKGTRSGRLGVRAALLLPWIAAAPGCLRGALYYDVVLPLDTDMDAAAYGAMASQLEAKTIQSPIGPRIQVDWDSNAIGDVMRSNGIVKGHYADEERLSILFGLFGYRRTIVSGDVAPKPTGAVSLDERRGDGSAEPVAGRTDRRGTAP